MKIEKNTEIKLKSFLGTLKPEKNTKNHNNYWKLIGEKGKVIDDIENYNGRVLILFTKNLDEFEVENHNPIKNSLWIKKTDLELEYTTSVSFIIVLFQKLPKFGNFTKNIKIWDATHQFLWAITSKILLMVELPKVDLKMPVKLFEQA